ncbi:MAG: transposase [Gammaproteobacteria bacterium]|nr:transposase [Gammaproteobacteria bacterium]
MVQYRRNLLPGATYFFTVNLADRRSCMLTEHVDILRSAFRKTRTAYPFAIEAIVVLPEHLHALITMPENDADYPGRWKAIKSAFTRMLRKQNIILPGLPEGGYRLWQRRYWEHTIRGDEDLQRHFDYIHYNPVKHGWVSRVVDWPYSSFHRYVRLGWLPVDWGGDNIKNEDGAAYGERKPGE